MKYEGGSLSEIRLTSPAGGQVTMSGCCNERSTDGPALEAVVVQKDSVVCTSDMPSEPPPHTVEGSPVLSQAHAAKRKASEGAAVSSSPAYQPRPVRLAWPAKSSRCRKPAPQACSLEAFSALSSGKVQRVSMLLGKATIDVDCPWPPSGPYHGGQRQRIATERDRRSSEPAAQNLA